MFFFFLLATGFFETWVVGSEIKVSFKTRAALDEKVSPRFSAGVYNATLFSFLFWLVGKEKRNSARSLVVHGNNHSRPVSVVLVFTRAAS